MPAPDAAPSIVRLDQGAVNARILARETATDLRRVEAAGVKIRVRLCSAEAKRLFVRMFHSFQVQSHFLSTIARIRIDDARISGLEKAARGAVEAASQRLNEAMDEAEALFKANGVQRIASYDTLALEMEVSVLSSLSRRFLETIVQMDQLMPVLQTLEIFEILTTSDIDRRRALVKRDLRTIVRDLRAVATSLRQEMGPAPSPPATPPSAQPAIAPGAPHAEGEAVRLAAEPIPILEAEDVSAAGCLPLPSKELLGTP